MGISKKSISENNEDIFCLGKEIKTEFSWAK